jgi:hypothetical protein
MRVCEVLLTAATAADHPNFSSPGQKVRCVVSFPALSEEESLSKVGEVLKAAALRLHHLERYSVFDRDESPTGDPAIDARMEDLRKFGQHLEVFSDKAVQRAP